MSSLIQVALAVLYFVLVQAANTDMPHQRAKDYSVETYLIW